ncbi:hypothetical protein ABZX77_02845 [Streptomyces sp. NPDC004237]|uniref:hypothetical protein n=1 Tax=Streptomyces sp. NPDC004237 TaxID=3154455 RepID=UPI00339EE536
MAGQVLLLGGPLDDGAPHAGQLALARGDVAQRPLRHEYGVIGVGPVEDVSQADEGLARVVVGEVALADQGDDGRHGLRGLLRRVQQQGTDLGAQGVRLGGDREDASDQLQVLGAGVAVVDPGVDLFDDADVVLRDGQLDQKVADGREPIGPGPLGRRDGVEPCKQRRVDVGPLLPEVEQDGTGVAALVVERDSPPGDLRAQGLEPGGQIGPGQDRPNAGLPRLAQEHPGSVLDGQRVLVVQEQGGDEQRAVLRLVLRAGEDLLDVGPPLLEGAERRLQPLCGVHGGGESVGQARAVRRTAVIGQQMHGLADQTCPGGSRVQPTEPVRPAMHVLQVRPCHPLGAGLGRCAGDDPGQRPGGGFGPPVLVGDHDQVRAHIEQLLGVTHQLLSEVAHVAPRTDLRGHVQQVPGARLVGQHRDVRGAGSLPVGPDLPKGQRPAGIGLFLLGDLPEGLDPGSAFAVAGRSGDDGQPGPTTGQTVHGLTRRPHLLVPRAQTHPREAYDVELRLRNAGHRQLRFARHGDGAGSHDDLRVLVVAYLDPQFGRRDGSRGSERLRNGTEFGLLAHRPPSGAR